MATSPLPYVTPERYLEYDRNSEFRNEYIHGEIIPMEAGMPFHSLIGANVGHQLGNRLSGTSCFVFNCQLRVSLDPQPWCVYPDVTLVCGELEYLDAKEDTITNPRIVVEVVPPAKLDYELGVKARLYWKVPTLTDLILIDQDEVFVEHFHRSTRGWSRTPAETLSDILKIESVNIEIPLSEIYANVKFPKE